ncbi:hypothetical protein GCM10007205_23980 [Oxalicibacterium flavum]|uniref:Cysteine-rich domain-containing protein n=1 Tax=Oxalicibacterium flavum TaxID=179467 RepID=A0A8J2UNG1_9BURK|nr:hypothetical protein GCM10007205_23980 [Oxalicibacterium flavum]
MLLLEGCVQPVMSPNINAATARVLDALGVQLIAAPKAGCGVTVKDYGHLLAGDPAYADKARIVSELARDLSEVIEPFAGELTAMTRGRLDRRVTWHPPCTLQHGQKIRGKVEAILREAGADVKLCADSHLCCGSAGTYSLLQPVLSKRLRDAKVARLEAAGSEVIASTNIGCLTHPQAGTKVPVRHWIELIDQALPAA